MQVGSILLAAGGSMRLGSPKQLLRYAGHSLLHRAATAVSASGCHPMVAVLGARAGDLRVELKNQNAAIVENVNWERGMGSSLRLGLETLLAAAHPGVPDGVLLTLCDQPLVGATQLRLLLDAFNGLKDTPNRLVAAAYGGTVGVPAVFGRQYFEELLSLTDEAGAKQILLAHRAELVEVSLPEAATDIDTREQYEQLAAGAFQASEGM